MQSPLFGLQKPVPFGRLYLLSKTAEKSGQTGGQVNQSNTNAHEHPLPHQLFA